MASKIGFYGAECYDTIHYLSRILKCMNYHVLLIDRSLDRSLQSSIPLPAGYRQEPDMLVEYRGVYFAEQFIYSYEDKFDFILIYFGRTGQRIMQLNWLFLMDDGDVRVRNALKGLSGKTQKILSHSSTGLAGGYDPSYPVFVSLGLVPLNAEKKSLGIPVGNCETVKVDTDDYILRLYCQQNELFTFRDITGAYQDFLYRIIQNITCCSDLKLLKRAYKAAERGK